ncbi:AlpA family phage regulatory protein [Cupriavidus gilardii]|uniref:AlpA family phage regulatory protein n=2 Tax=Cupriavidus gilardii TaxID=82541 RepID=A0ABY4VY65_9BURK|nr:AlpA family phage regulatory protein [Cupriavidus gilardii]USE81132.1 AlpA family phage regulatory protein [Cupriavidus gilardii]
MSAIDRSKGPTTALYDPISSGRPNSERILRLPEVQQRIGLSRSSIYARIQEGSFPRPIKLGHASGWIETEVHAWIVRQIEQTRTR